jgi:hypothetical protein
VRYNVAHLARCGLTTLSGACLLVLVLAGSATTAPHPNAPAQLLARYAPVLVLHPQESFRPSRVDGFLADSDLVDGHHDQRLCQAVGGPNALSCYVAADRAHGAAAAYYGAAFRNGQRIVLEYWLFYPFDLYTYANPLGAVWQSHEGDWEAVAVVLDRKGVPLFVGASHHCVGTRRAWARVEKRGSRPLIYVALGSHANYFAPGLAPIANRCLPPQAQAALRQYGVTLVDEVARGRTVTGAPVVPVTATTPEWMTFAGTWGEAQYVQVPNQSPVAYGFGPSGPAFHALWRQPFATASSWPVG